MIIHPGDQKLAEMLGAGGACFVCEAPVEPTFVHWRGTDSEGEAVTLAMHPRCAEHFALRFMRDVYELDQGEALTFGPAPDIRPPDIGGAA